MRKASWISSPTVRRRRLPKCSYSSRSPAISSRGIVAASAGEVLRVLGQADLDGQVDEPADELHQVVGHAGQAAGEARAGERADVRADVQAEAGVELVAADLREVVALGVEEQRAHERARVVDRRRLARTLLLEDLDEGVLHDVARARVELLLELLDLGLDLGALVGGGVLEPGRRASGSGFTIFSISFRLLRSPVCGAPSVASLSRVAWMKGLHAVRVARGAGRGWRRRRACSRARTAAW